MRKAAIPFLLMLSLVLLVPLTQANYETKPLIISKFKALVSAHLSEASYINIGKSPRGTDILMFRFGNSSSKSIVLWDAQMHGTEDAGAETAFLFCQWLFSGDVRASYVLSHNWILIIPCLNDLYERTNENHVNINRNFPVGWGTYGSADNSSGDYWGPSPASEPETVAMMNVFKNYRPRFYVNTHMYGGPIVYYHWKVPPSVIAAWMSALATFAQFYGYNPLKYSALVKTNGGGFAVTTAMETYGVYSFLWEIGGSESPTYSELLGTYYRQTRCFLLALCSMCG
jgi:hypothetical protein